MRILMFFSVSGDPRFSLYSNLNCGFDDVKVFIYHILDDDYNQIISNLDLGGDIILLLWVLLNLFK